GLIDFDARTELLVLVADRFDGFFVGQEALVDADCERLCVRLRVFYRDVDFELAEHRAANPFGKLRLLTVRTAVDVQPAVARTIFCAAEVVGLDNERVPFPTTYRIAVPPGLGITCRRKLSSIHIDEASAVISLIKKDNEIRRLNDLARLRLHVELR